MFEIRRYTQQDEKAWNEFVGRSKNGTFLHLRTYMDYHSDRFADHSLIFSDDHGIYAMLPANQVGDTIYSHQGLTYGGLIVDDRATVEGVRTLFTALNDYLSRLGIGKVVYKAIPWIYHRQPSEEDLYAMLNVCNARINVRHVSTTISLASPIRWRRDHRYGANKAFAEGVIVERSDDYDAFWQILTGNLWQKYGARPVHTIEEIKLLHQRFPQNIRLYTALKEGRTVGGTVLYLCGEVVHAQYISASEEGKRLHAVDALFRHILTEERWDAKFFDFGKSSDGDGHDLNTSLISQKEGFGGRAICYDWYEWETTI